MESTNVGLCLYTLIRLRFLERITTYLNIPLNNVTFIGSIVVLYFGIAYCRNLSLARYLHSTGNLGRLLRALESPITEAHRSRLEAPGGADSVSGYRLVDQDSLAYSTPSGGGSFMPLSPSRNIRRGFNGITLTVKLLASPNLFFYVTLRHALLIFSLKIKFSTPANNE